MPPKKPQDERDEERKVPIVCEMCGKEATQAVEDFMRSHDPIGRVMYTKMGETHGFCDEHARDSIVKDA